MLIKNSLIVLSGPSGAGKGTLCKALIERNSSVHCAVSATSRDCRGAEIPGVSYHYIGREVFIKKITECAFLEYAEVYGNYYGTLKEEVFSMLEMGYDVILEIDIQGAMQIKENYKNAIFIFVMPPSFTELKNRIYNRGRDSMEDIEKRMEEVRRELNYISEYDYVVVNDEVDKAVDKMEAILMAEKCRLFKRTIDVDAFIEE
ncbi:guanylate kinase [endosymbiont 'TC1' of Trimyema compressum]|uniref:guanylate kinase n=1 Tax=endosymbiont 'TC1' of Trimyema compressum TaxID=243899 RepID=UPI0007F0759B|nr:guanylate kinase [endosymbiont 'TC1' of Trimyema compressum]AMP20490.1 guanylate kinase [endosymbiont 'TC1' of Trimyema compressum]